MEYRAVPDIMYEPSQNPGKLIRFSYDTETYDPQRLSVRKDALVYLPYGYDAEPSRRYPVLFLMHGGGGNCEELFGGEEARTPLKNLLDQAVSQGHCKPMIVVAPSYFLPDREDAHRDVGQACMLTHRFPTELREDLIPAVDAAFRTLADRRMRAFGGFSMGAEATWSVLSECLPQVASYLPMSGDYWTICVKGGKEHPRETVQALLRKIQASGVEPEDYRIFACTGDRDIAWEAMDPMIREMYGHTPWFRPEQPGCPGNLHYCLKPEGYHTYDDCWEYLYLAMPHLF